MHISILAVINAAAATCVAAAPITLDKSVITVLDPNRHWTVDTEKPVKATLKNDPMRYSNITVDESLAGTEKNGTPAALANHEVVALIQQSEARKGSNSKRYVSTVAAHDLSKTLATNTDKPQTPFLEGTLIEHEGVMEKELETVTRTKDEKLVPLTNEEVMGVMIDSGRPKDKAREKRSASPGAARDPSKHATTKIDKPQRTFLEWSLIDSEKMPEKMVEALTRTKDGKVIPLTDDEISGAMIDFANTGQDKPSHTDKSSSFIVPRDTHEFRMPDDTPGPETRGDRQESDMVDALMTDEEQEGLRTTREGNFTILTDEQVEAGIKMSKAAKKGSPNSYTVTTPPPLNTSSSGKEVQTNRLAQVLNMMYHNMPPHEIEPLFYSWTNRDWVPGTDEQAIAAIKKWDSSKHE